METTQTSLMPHFLSACIGDPKVEPETRNPESFFASDSELRTLNPELYTRPVSNADGPNVERRTLNAAPFTPIQVITPELILVDWGPMTLTLSVWADGQPRPIMAVQAAIQALELLNQLAGYQSLLKIPMARLKKDNHLPFLIRPIFSACRKVSVELAGMAAVAGLVADELVKSALALGGDRIIVNNGGDIALGLKKKQKIRVGLIDPFEEKISHVLEIIPEQGIGGVATSGWRGRSFSPGIADAVSVWATDCVTADAAATWIAGQMKLDSPKVVRRPAKELDPETDIPHLLITREVAPLTYEEKETVLAAGLAIARGLIEKGVIRGAFMAIQGKYRMIAFQKPFPLSLNPN